jgi:hypothetical protein
VSTGLDYGSLSLLFALLWSIIVLCIMWLWLGARDILFVVSLFYFYFAFGPVINLLLGRPIYYGTIQSKIPEATIIFALALSGLLLGAILIKPRSKFDVGRLLRYKKEFTALRLGLVCAIFYTAGVILWNGPLLFGGFAGQSKNQKIELLGASMHYGYLLIQFCLLSFYFLARNSSLTYRLYSINFLLYVVYCLLFEERDFILILVSIIIHRLTVGELRLNWKLVVFAVSLIYGATYVFVSRQGGERVVVEDVLNQGSLLFVNTTILHWKDVYAVPFEYGSTYAHSLLNLLPSWIYQSEFSLPQWFRSIYAPGGDSGYGFSADAEAYLNFGYLGVFFVFAALALVQRGLCIRFDRHPFFAYMSVYFTAWLMYALRNDSVALVRGAFVASIVFAIVYFSPTVVLRSRANDRRTPTMKFRRNHSAIPNNRSIRIQLRTGSPPSGTNPKAGSP